MHRVAILALDGVIASDVAMPVDTLRGVRRADGQLAYEVRVCAPTPEVASAHLTLRAPHGLEAIAAADTVIVAGRDQFDAPSGDAALAALRAAARRGARVASICVGAFTLAEAGLLDGRRATTHWAAAAELARRYPAITVDPDVLFVDEGRILTSAGAAAGLDLCLYLVRRDHGAAVAATAARAAVMPLERAGGQAQFIRHPAPALAPGPSGDRAGVSLGPLLHWAEAHLGEELTVDRLAARAGLPPRTFARRFREQTGTTPLRWVLRARVRRAQELLETTGLAVEAVGRAVGFGSPAAFRDQFRRAAGTSPQAYRQAFRAPAG